MLTEQDTEKLSATELSITGREVQRVSRSWEMRHFPELASAYAIRPAVPGGWQLLTLSFFYIPTEAAQQKLCPSCWLYYKGMALRPIYLFYLFILFITIYSILRIRNTYSQLEAPFMLLEKKLSGLLHVSW